MAVVDAFLNGQKLLLFIYQQQRMYKEKRQAQKSESFEVITRTQTVENYNLLNLRSGPYLQ